MKYVLWQVSNGWLMTQSTTIWENWDHRSKYAVFHSLKEFSDWAEEHAPESQPQPKSRTHGKFATKPTNRIKEHAGRTTART